ncbi:hypothetical protein J1N35_023179 [Gossypium stocksii]|uniref:H15 domain-containing protein n=1 Tax=Gossypium stocksii TaxID=47602 RepID=A0A9D3VIB3_9ROSI|nr:hypothetical protein J1N35_023179 [Gossypium stocksii]
MKFFSDFFIFKALPYDIILGQATNAQNGVVLKSDPSIDPTSSKDPRVFSKWDICANSPPAFVARYNVKKFVASGKLVKVKTSYKLPLASFVAKKPATAKPKATSAAIKPKPMVVKAPTKSKAKSKVATPMKAKAKDTVKPKPKAKAVTKPTKVMKMVKTSSTGKKVKALAKKKSVVAKKPKSVKSPAKKAAKKATK